MEGNRARIEDVIRLTTPKNRDKRNPSASPDDILGNNTPITPPTSAPTRTNMVRNTPNNFISKSEGHFARDRRLEKRITNSVHVIIDYYFHIWDKS